MMKNHKHPFSRWFGPVLCLLSLIFLAAGPAMAGEDVKGWVVALDVALTQPGGLDQDFAFQSQGTSSQTQGEWHAMDNDSDVTFRLSAGYNFGPNLGGLKVSYWSFDHEDKQSDSLSGNVLPTVFGYGYASYQTPYLTPTNAPGVGTWASSSVRASILDVDYSRAVEVGENFTFRWLAGLRTATFEEERTVELQGEGRYYYQAAYATVYIPTQINQSRHIDSSARGLKVGGQGSFDITRHQRVEAGLALSLLQGDSRGDARQSFNYFPDGSGIPVTVSEATRGEDKSNQGQILDLDVRWVWTTDPLSIYFGYAKSSWEGLVRDPNPPVTAFYPLAAGRSRDTVSFSGFNVGVIYRFGARGVISAP